MDTATLKRQAALAALELVEPGMRLGLGSGSTAEIFVEELGKRVADGLKISGVATSRRTEELARSLAITITDFDERPYLDLTIDGADELDEELRLIKGGGGALLREKIVATASESMIVIADTTKLVPALGAFPLPVEVVQFGLGATKAMIKDLAEDIGCEGDIKLRKGATGETFITDSGNFILDCAFKRIDEPEILDSALKFVPGVVEHGLFLDLADKALIAGQDGVKTIAAPEDEFEV